MLTKQQVVDRLGELVMLKAGWLDGRGERPNENVLNVLLFHVVFDLFPAHHMPRIYPMESGALQLEWGNELVTAGGWYDSLEIELDNGLAFAKFHGWNADTDTEMSFADVLNEELWEKIGQTLNEHYPGEA
jgi:hypothetical protein